MIPLYLAVISLQLMFAFDCYFDIASMATRGSTSILTVDHVVPYPPCTYSNAISS